MYNNRKYQRYSAVLPCVIEASGVSFRSETADVSLGGIRVRLPSLSKVFLTGPVRAIKIEGLPSMRVKTRWTNQIYVGAEFTELRYAQPHIRRLIDELDLEPDDLDMTPRQAVHAI